MAVDPRYPLMAEDDEPEIPADDSRYPLQPGETPTDTDGDDVDLVIVTPQGPPGPAGPAGPAGADGTGSGVQTASVVLYCPTLTPEDLTPADGDTMYWVEYTPSLSAPDAATGLYDWTSMEEFTWSEGWATVNDPTNVLIIPLNEGLPNILAEVTPTGFTAIEVLGMQPIILGCGGAPGVPGGGALWAGWNIGEGQSSAPDPTQPATYITPTGTLADQVRIVDRSGGGDHTTLGAWLAADPIGAAIAAGAAVLASVYVPWPVDLFGGSFDGDTATIPTAPETESGSTLLLTEQTDSANNDMWVYQGDNLYQRADPSALVAGRVGTLIVAQSNPLVSAPQLLRVVAGRGVEVLKVDSEGIPIVAEYLVAVDAVDGTATTFQPLKRADDAPANGIIPAQYLARGGPRDVSDHVGQYVVVPTIDIPDDPSDYGRLYRIEAEGTAWTDTPVGGNETIIVVGGSDAGLPEWWVNRDTGPRPVQMSAHNVRLSRDVDVNTPDTLKPWTDLNEVTTVLARAIEWTFIGVADDWSWPSGLDRPSLWYTVDNPVAVPVTGTLPPLNDFAVGRSVRVTSFTAQPVAIVTDEDATTLATLGELDTYEFTSWGGGWMVSHISIPDAGDVVGPASSVADRPALFDGESGRLLKQGSAALGTAAYADATDYAAASHTHDTLANITGPTIIGRASGSGDSEELTVPQVRTLLAQPEVLLHSETVAADAASKSYDVTGWNKIRVEFTGRGTRNSTIIGLYATLNGNTGNVYSTNAAAMTSAWALGTVPGSATNTDRRGMVKAEIELMSGAWKEGLSWGTNHGSTATVGQAPAWVGLLSSITTAVTSIELKMQLDNIAAGAHIRIIGMEAT